MTAYLRRFPVSIILMGVFCTATPVGLTQEVIPPIQSNGALIDAPKDGVYFADILVRGKPVFQIGSLAQVSSSDRANIINRRIASLLAQSDPTEPVTVQPDTPRKIATLQVNNRVLMTVTQQDAQDFGLSLEVLAQQWAERLNSAFEKPPLAIDAGQRLYETVRQLLEDILESLPSLIGAIVVVGLTWSVAKAVRYVAFTWAQQTEGDVSTEILISRLSYSGVWVVGGVIALGVLGLDLAAMLGTLGLTSVAIGFGLKDVLSNYISGVILLAARPFGINDQVVISEYEGTVIQIQLRATTMRTYDGRLVYIPNQEVFQASIINNTASPRRRSSLMIGIDYDEDIGRAQQVISRVLGNLLQVEKEPSPEVLVRELAASTVNLEVRFWVDSRRAGFLTITSEVAQAIKEALQEANIEMPTDIYTLIFRNFPAELEK